jgi:uncharacterized phage-associated protein
MANAVDVARYIRSTGTVTGGLQLQKLVYYAQAWHLVWNGRPLFDEAIDAWKLGPVVPEVRRDYEAHNDPFATQSAFDC